MIMRDYSDEELQGVPAEASRFNVLPTSTRVNEDGTKEYPEDWTEEQVAKAEAYDAAWRETIRTGDSRFLP